MRVLKFHVRGTQIEKDSNCDFDNIVRGSNNWLQLEFDFDKEWNRTSRVISLKNLDGEEKNIILQNKVVLPEEVTKGSIFSFVLYGKDGDKKIQTNRMIINQI